MACFVATLLAAPWYVWGVVCALVGLAVFVLFSAGYFFGVDRWAARRRS
jgi:hypothetical protein